MSPEFSKVKTSSGAVRKPEGAHPRFRRVLLDLDHAAFELHFLSPPDFPAFAGLNESVNMDFSLADGDFCSPATRAYACSLQELHQFNVPAFEHFKRKSYDH